MLANQHNTETQKCQLTAPHHMANEKGRGKRRGNTNPPLKPKLPHTLQRLHCVRFHFVSACWTWAKLNLGSPKEGLRQGDVRGGWREAEPPAPKPNVAPLPSSAARTRSSSLGGSQERQGEWYQSNITKYSEHNNVYSHMHL